VSNELHALINRVDGIDSPLAQELRKHIEAITRRREFGLVFERHLPESVALINRRISVGDAVRFIPARGKVSAESGATWTVTKIKVESGAQVAELFEPRTKEEASRAIEDLVCLADFRDPIFPGLESMKRVEEGGNTPTHVVINGENFHALEALLFAHQGSIDVIYIDPPYNTGGKSSWLYNDNYVDGDDAYKHSKWLAFMERRLRLARKLLRDTGVLFVSIDDAEQHRLRMLLDQVLGEDNFVDTLAVEMSTTSGPKTTNAQQGTIVKNVEFVHIYRKSAAFDQVRHTPLFDGVPQWDGDYTLWLNDDGTITEFVDEIAKDPDVAKDIVKYDLVKKSGVFIGMAAMGKLLAVSEAANAFVLANLDRIARRDIPPASCKDMDAPVRGWIEVEADHRTYVLTRLRSGTLNQVYTLRRNYRGSDDYRPRFGRTVIRGDLWKGFHQDMGNVSREGGVAFTNGKKPVRLIKQLIRWANNSPDALVLDFFGGSGTAAHAVIAMNSEDGGRRRAIVVTNNEVPEKAATSMRKQGLRPGDEAWEAEGVCEAVAIPRLTNVATSPATPANVEFFRLTYQDPALVELHLVFPAVAPLLWIRAGAQGRRIDQPTDTFDIADTYAVLFNIDATRAFLTAVEKAHDLRLAFIVTDDETQYQAVASQLPEGIESVRLYESYLRSSQINAERV
jgi:adenine-specific DNA-methyltransferase